MPGVVVVGCLMHSPLFNNAGYPFVPERHSYVGDRFLRVHE